MKSSRWPRNYISLFLPEWFSPPIVHTVKYMYAVGLNCTTQTGPRKYFHASMAKRGGDKWQ